MFGVCLRKSARSAGDTGVSIEQYNLSTLACYSPADYADDAEECSRLHYHAEKDNLFEVKAVLWFWGFVCDYLRDLRETSGVSFVQY